MRQQLRLDAQACARPRGAPDPAHMFDQQTAVLCASASSRCMPTAFQLATSPTALCAAPKWGSRSVLHRRYGAYQHSVQHHKQAHVCGALAVTSITALLPCYPYMHHQPRWRMHAKHRRSSVNQCGKYRTSLCCCFPANGVNLNLS
jgi:hypothetical protein